MRSELDNRQLFHFGRIGEVFADKKNANDWNTKKNKPDIPKAFVVKEVLDEKGEVVRNNNRKVYRPAQSSFFGFSERMALCSYVPKPNKCVILPSTQHTTSAAVSRPKNKPEMILDYNKTKWGVDVFDQIVSTYSCSRQTHRWPMVVFYNFLDVSGLDAYLIHCNNQPPTINIKRYRLKMINELARDLMEPMIQSRLINTGAIRKSAVDALRILGYIDPVTTVCDQPVPPPPEDRLLRIQARCSLCPRSKDKKTKTTCDFCHKPACGSCHFKICIKCRELQISIN